MDRDRRSVLGALALGGVVGASARPAVAGDSACRTLTAERRGYAVGPLGQTHYRLQGRGAPVLLLHETPWSSHQYAHVQPILARAGYMAVAADTPGYGMSPAPACQPRLEAYAAQMIALLDALGIRRATLAGDHTGAGLAIVMAARWPDRVDAIVLYGPPIYTDEERAARLGNFSRYAPQVVLRENGAHLSDRFVFVREIMTGRVGSLEGVQDSTLAFMMAEDKQQMVLRALFEHPSLAEDLSRVRARGLLLCSPDDTLRAGAERVRRLRPDFTVANLMGGGPQLVFDRPEAWADPVLDFLRRARG